MKKFIVLYHAPKAAAEKMAGSTPEEMQEGMKPWMEWKEKCGEGMVDMGTPLGNARKMTKTDHGPSDSTVVGYSVLQAEDWDGVQKMVEGHPHLNWVDGCEIEVHECLPLPGSQSA